MIQRIIGFTKKLNAPFIFILKSIYLNSKNIKYQRLPLFSGNWPMFVVHGKCSMGQGCHFRSFRTKTVLTVLLKGNLEIGNYTFINDGVNICAAKNIIIGDHTKIGDMVCIYDTDFHQVNPGSPMRCHDVIIGRNVWLGAKAIILPGVVIGDHSVVAAGAIVNETVPPKCIVSGVPAKVTKKFECPDGWIRS
jgi:acetyltransferase-like isoleucine patch superfamily enzyme